MTRLSPRLFNGGVHFVTDDKTPPIVLSYQQLRVLRAIGKDGIERRELHKSVIGSDKPLTGSQRASLSRSVKRLVDLNIIHEVDKKLHLKDDATDFYDFLERGLWLSHDDPNRKAER